MKTLILILTKGPHRYRFGPRRFHDWVVSCKEATRLQATFPEATVFVPSAVSISGHLPELEYYRCELRSHGLDERISVNGLRKLVTEHTGQETMEQILCAHDLATRECAKLVVLSTWTHFPRILYLCRGKKVIHRVAWGIPNPVEAVTDLALTLVFPILDLLGLGERFQRWTIKCRTTGRYT